MDRRAWWATVCGIAENQTHLSDEAQRERERERERKELPLKCPAEMSYPCTVSPRKDSSASAAKPRAQMGSCYSWSLLSYRRPALDPNPRV